MVAGKVAVERGLAQFGEYELIRELGRGASASAYLARPRQSSERLCLKIFHPRLFRDENFLKRVNREFEVSAGLRHPNIVGIRSILRTEPPALVMDFIDGENLELFQAKLPYILPEVSALIVIEILKALEYAHAQGVIHRDLKPENVLIEKTGRVLVTDFGLAKFEDSTTNITQPQAIVGSTDYMSPEQVSGDVMTSSSDLFSVGSLFYFLATGTRPFSRGSALATLNSIRQDGIEPPDRRNPKISAPLSRILQRALAKEPGERYPSAKEFRSALENYMQSLGLHGEDMSFPSWLRDPGGATVRMLQASAESLAIAAEKAAVPGEWPKSLELLAHLSLKAPESPAINRVTFKIRRARRPRRWGTAAASIALAVVAAIGVRSCDWKKTTAPQASAPTLREVTPQTEVLPVPIVTANRTEPAKASSPRPRPKPVVTLIPVQFKVGSDVTVFWRGKQIDPKEPLMERPGTYQLVLQKEGFAPIEQQIRVGGSKPVVVNVE